MWNVVYFAITSIIFENILQIFFCSFTSRASWLELNFLFLIYKDLRKKIKTCSSHVLLFGEFFSWFPLTGIIGSFLAQGQRLKVSATPVPSSCANCFLGISPIGFFFVQRLIIFGKDPLTLEEGLPLSMFSYLESIVLCPTAGIHKTNSLI